MLLMMLACKGDPAEQVFTGEIFTDATTTLLSTKQSLQEDRLARTAKEAVDAVPHVAARHLAKSLEANDRETWQKYEQIKNEYGN